LAEEMDGTCSSCRREGKFIQILSWEPAGKMLFGQPWVMWENNIKIDHKEIYLIDVE